MLRIEVAVKVHPRVYSGVGFSFYRDTKMPFYVIREVNTDPCVYSTDKHQTLKRAAQARCLFTHGLPPSSRARFFVPCSRLFTSR